MATKDLTEILKSPPLESRRTSFDIDKFSKDTLKEIKSILDKRDLYGIIFINSATLETTPLKELFKEQLKEYHFQFKTLNSIVDENFLLKLNEGRGEKDFYFIHHPDMINFEIDFNLIKDYYQINLETIKKDNRYKKIIDNFP